jgi:hypothetical protein
MIAHFGAPASNMRSGALPPASMFTASSPVTPSPTVRRDDGFVPPTPTRPALLSVSSGLPEV